MPVESASLTSMTNTTTDDIEDIEDEGYRCDNCGQWAEPDWVEAHACFSEWNGPLKGEHIKAASWGGIAFWVEHDNGEDEIIAVMVGDDRRHRIDRDDVTVISEDDYCAGCGQLGPPFCFGYGPQED